MRIILMLAAALHLSTASSVVAESRDSEVQKAYRALLENMAHQRVNQQLCRDYPTSTMRELTDMALDFAERYQIMPCSKAIDIINDEQALRRVVAGRRCADSHVKPEETNAIRDRFFEVLRGHNP